MVAMYKRRNLANALSAWRGTNYPAIAAWSRGEGVFNNRRPAKYSTHVKQWGRNLGAQMKPKNNWTTKYIYRGIRVRSLNNIKNTQGFSSWTSNINIARRKFAYDPAGSYSRVFRINTNLLKGVPVVNVGGPESEYILPPMRMILNNFNGSFLPVKDVRFNQRWVSHNRPSMIPRMATRRITLFNAA